MKCEQERTNTQTISFSSAHCPGKSNDNTKKKKKIKEVMYFIPFTVHVQKQVADRSPHAQVYCFKSIFNPKHLLVFDSWGRSSSGTVRLGDWCMKTNGSAQECQISFGKPFYCVCSVVLLRSQLKEKYSELIASFQSHILMG